MTIDTSPEALAAIKEKMADKNYGKSSPTYIIMALIDALEEARAHDLETYRLLCLTRQDLEEARAALRIVKGIRWEACESEVMLDPNLPPAARRIIAQLIDDMKSPAIMPKTTGEDHYDATKHVIGEHARDWVKRNRS